jgi:endoglucanase
MDVSGASTADGTPVIQWTSSAGANQQFRLNTSTGGGTGGSGGTGGTAGSGGTAGTGGSGGTGGTGGTPVSRWGQLRVCGTRICNAAGTPVQLKGTSSMWLNWEGSYSVNKSAMQWMRDNWRMTVFRAAMGVEPTGAYLTDPTRMRSMVNTNVQNAIDLGVYVIIDWHDHNAQNHRSQAVSFFTDMATRWGSHPNVIYEPFNEPLQVSWSSTLKPYHEAVVSAIRQRDADNLIILGTPNWSQYVDQAANDPVRGTNLLYTLHFYSCSHTQWLRDRGNYAMSRGLPLFVTEWGATHADGGLDGRVCLEEGQRWHDWMNQNGVGWAAWKLDDCTDSSCLLRNGAPASGGWDSWLQGHGPFVRDRMRQ